MTPGTVQSLSEIDWEGFRPTDTATLMFVVRRGQVLLIRKKLGLGAGKINAPGGRLEPGETPAEAAVRETVEEVCVTPLGARKRGELRFQFVDGYALHCHVFSADDCVGEVRETSEAVPMWVPLDAIPYHEMWADDALWLPLMLSGQGFSGRFVFDADRMVDHALEVDDPAARLFARLEALAIRAETVRHPPVFTVEQARAHRARHDGAHIKNLFLRNKKGKSWLVTTLEDRPINLKDLGLRLGAGHVSFASPERLRQHLGVEAGSVTPFAAMNDGDGSVQVAVDRRVLTHEFVHCHPLTNDRTTSISTNDLVRFLDDTGHPPQLLDLDGDEPA